MKTRAASMCMMVLSIATMAASALAGVPGTEIPSVPFTATGDSTGGTNSINSVPDFCSQRMTVDGPEAVYFFTPHAGANLTFTVTPQNATFDPAIYVTFAPAAGDACLWGSDANGPGEAETFPINDRLTPETVHYFYVDSFFDAGTAPANAQGPFQLDVGGSLPVELIRFEVE
jgi:hypothetical protein